MWEVIGEPVRLPSTRYAALCKCSCGLERLVQLKGGKHGTPVSLECLKCKNSRTKHGHTVGGSQSKTYAVWHAMLDRCYNTKCKSYPRYGGRGINVTERWHTFSNFLTDMGEKPDGLSIERKDNGGSYCKENCEWIPTLDQAKNRRDLRMVSYGGETLHIAEWSRRTGVKYHTIRWRLDRGWSPGEALGLEVRADRT